MTSVFVKASKAPEGATTGATTGGVAGEEFLLGLLAGIGALAIPGVGPFIAAGPIMAALSGAAVGATTGGLVGGFIGMGVPEFEAKRYEGKLQGPATTSSRCTRMMAMKTSRERRLQKPARAPMTSRRHRCRRLLKPLRSNQK